MDQHDQAILWSSVEANYRTPPECFEALKREFDFGTDLAADVQSKLVTRYLGPESSWGEDALAADWQRFSDSPMFLNPPFSKTLANAYRTGRIKIDGKWVEHEKNKVKAGWYDIENWARKCWEESLRGATIVGIFPFAPQTDWYRAYVQGHVQGEIVDGRYPITWNGHAAREERRLPHRISFLTPNGTPTGNAGVNSVILVWKPNPGIVGPWQPHSFYWSYR